MTTAPLLADLALLLRAVIANPADDAPRLVYADALDECGQHERAEFIRVQCELANGKCFCFSPDGIGCEDRSCRSCKTVDDLRRWERELWDELAWAFFDELKAVAGKGWAIGFKPDVPGATAPRATYSRGFVASISLTTAAFMGGVCDNTPHCRDGKESRGAFGTQPCYRCHGSGRTDGVAAALFASQPIERVILNDAIHSREYGGGDDRWAVSRQRVGPLWKILCPDGDHPDYGFLESRDRGQLESNVSAACVAHGRGLVPWLANVG